jgi:hypothetical protein|tara:strand:+ start:651 stop:884 length:234 start_codon:yes stop_codon:yes gene_type:complete
MKPNFVWDAAMLKHMTVFLGDLDAIPGAVAEFFFGPSPAIPGRSFVTRRAVLALACGHRSSPYYHAYWLGGHCQASK